MMNEGSAQPRGSRGESGAEVPGGAGEETTGPGAAARGGQPTGFEPAGGRGAAPKALPAGWGRFLVAPRPLGLLPGAVPPIEFPVLLALLEEDTEVRVLGHLRPARARGLGAIAEPAPACPPIAIVAMPPRRAAALAGNPQVVLEPDQALHYPASNPVSSMVPAAEPALAVVLAEPTALRVRVHDRNNAPVPGAHVWAIGSTAPVHAVTDTKGVATVALTADTPQTLRSVYVRPIGGYWPSLVDGVDLPQDDQSEMGVHVRALGEDFEGFPGKAMTGWGVSVMRLTQIPPTFRGHGIRIALIDSGISATHPDLKDQVAGGYDITAASESSWDQDATGHGTWCAGVIAAADNRTGIAGIAADAALHALKVYPDGRVSHLLQALDWCIGHDINIAQINLACPQPSQLLAWKIIDTRAAGTLCIAPAGDTGAAPAFPAALPTVISVGALAHAGTAPRTFHAPAGQAGWPGPYTPAFTPPGADLAAPGCAIVTTSPDGDYTPADGTALAAAHITALAALLLAHHDQLRTPLASHAGARVDQLTSLLRASCRPLPGADPTRAGVGLPDAPTALALTGPTWPTSATPAAAGAGATAYTHHS